MYFPSSSTSSMSSSSSPRRRASSEARNREASDCSLGSRQQEDRGLHLRDWAQERHQLQHENERLAEKLDAANKQIRFLRKKLPRESDDGSVSSHAVTVKAGSSRKLNTKQKKQKFFSKLFGREDKNGKVVVKSKSSSRVEPRRSSNDDDDDSQMAVTWEAPSPRSHRSSKRKMYPEIKLDRSFDSTEASSRASLAEF